MSRRHSGGLREIRALRALLDSHVASRRPASLDDLEVPPEPTAEPEAYCGRCDQPTRVGPEGCRACQGRLS